MANSVDQGFACVEDRVKLAYHEAGHAVVAHFLGLVCTSVSIVADEESARRCHVPLPEGFQPDEQREGSTEVLEAHLAVTVAGALAVELFNGEPMDLEGQDFDSASILAASLKPENLLRRSRREGQRHLVEVVDRRGGVGREALGGLGTRRRAVNGVVWGREGMADAND